MEKKIAMQKSFELNVNFYSEVENVLLNHLGYQRGMRDVCFISYGDKLVHNLTFINHGQDGSGHPATVVISEMISVQPELREASLVERSELLMRLLKTPQGYYISLSPEHGSSTERETLVEATAMLDCAVHLINTDMRKNV